MFGVASGFAPIFRISNSDAVDIMMRKYDTDKSGNLDIDEAQGVPILSRANFPTADSLGDGKLTKEEFVSYMDTMKLALAQGGGPNPASLLMAGGAITQSTFDQIHAEAGSRSGKMQFINYMNHLTNEYEEAQREGLDIEA